MSIAEERFQINAPKVVSEVIDGEVVILNLRSGNYYSAENLGAVLWSWMETGKSMAEMREALASRYPARPTAELDNAVKQFFHDLQEHELIVSGNGQVKVGSAANGAPELAAEFEAPTLNCYSDMQDLLLLDPVHDVDDAGWPTPKASEPVGS